MQTPFGYDGEGAVVHAFRSDGALAVEPPSPSLNAIISSNVVHLGQILLGSPDDVIVIIHLPDRPRPANKPIDPMAADGLPRLHNPTQGSSRSKGETDMNMIRHYAIGMQEIIGSIPVPERGPHDGEGAVATKNTRAMSRIKILFDIRRIKPPKLTYFIRRQCLSQQLPIAKRQPCLLPLPKLFLRH